MTPHDALLHLGRWLQEQDYRFVTVTPATHARVNARDGDAGGTLRDIFGWSRAFTPDALAPTAIGWLRDADMLEERGGKLRSRVRFSTLRDQLFVHSAYPTGAEDAVFFGPDTYRFANLVGSVLAAREPQGIRRILDVGCGAGPGGIVAARTLEFTSPELVLTDINPAALALARVNADLAQLSSVSLTQGDLYAPVAGEFDLIVSNPPYLLDAKQRLYRHGGGELGGGLSLRIVEEGLPRLAPGGTLVLYTGSPIVNGRDPLLVATQEALGRANAAFTYDEIDPDVFGEELEAPAYAGAERIAAVALVVHKPLA